MNCLRARKEIKAYVDGELRPVMRRRIARHIARCADCCEEVRIMTELTNGVQRMPGVPAPDDLKAKVLSKLQFEPAAQPVRRWTFMSRSFGIALILLAVVAIGATVCPVFMPARYVSIPAEIEREAESAAPAAKPSMPAVSQAIRTHSKAMPMAEQKSDKFARYLGEDSHMPQMIVKSADLSLQVKDSGRASDAATRISREEGGYVTDSSASSESGSPAECGIVLCIPVDRFEQTVEKLCALGKVKTRNLSGNDVTGEVVDLESRLRNKRAEEHQYLQIMNGAKRIPDIVTVTNELSRVRGEIEETQGRLKYLRSSANMSTINLTLSEKPKLKPAAQSGVINTFHNASSSFVITGSILASLLIWLAVYSPFWGLPLLAIVYMKKRAAAAQ